MSWPSVTLPGFPELQVLSVQETLTTAELDNPRLCCAECSLATRRGARLSVTLHDLPRGWRPFQLRIFYRRYECRNKCAQPHPLVTAGIRASRQDADLTLTARLYSALVDRYLRGATVPALSAWSGVKQATLWNLLEHEIKERLMARRDTRAWGQITHIGLDELFWQGQPLGVVIDLVSGELLDLLPDRDHDTMVECLTDLKQHVEAIRGEPWSPVCVTDMWLNFREVVTQVFGLDVHLVVDHFHLAVKVSQDLQQSAQALLKQDAQLKVKLRRLRDDYQCALKTGEVVCSLAAGEDPEVGRQLCEYLQLAFDFHAIWRAPTLAAAEQALGAWVFRVYDTSPAGAHRPFSRLAYQLKLWRDEVLAYHHPDCQLPCSVRRQPTNALTENTNGRLRKLEQRSRASRRLERHQTESPQAEGPRLQRQFNRFYLRAMHTINVPRPAQTELGSSICPVSATCRCGVPAERLSVQAGLARSLVDLPQGDHPVNALASVLLTQCPECSLQQTLEVPQIHGMTSRLYAALTDQAALSRPWHRLARETGLVPETLQRRLTLPPLSLPVAGRDVGLLRWVWRQKPYWLVTEIGSGRPLELFPLERHHLHAYLNSAAGQAVQRVFVSTPAWCTDLPSRIRPVLDTFTAIGLVQPGLREVQRRFTESRPVARRRAAEFKNHRRLILERPFASATREQRTAEPDPEPRRARILKLDAALFQAHAQMQLYRTVLTSGAGDTPDRVGALEAWIRQVNPPSTSESLPSTPLSSDPQLARSYDAAFRLARGGVWKYRKAVALGIEARGEQADGSGRLSLAASKRKLGGLKSLEAAATANFATLRRAVLGPLGEQA